MGTQRSLGLDDIGSAWHFVEECEDAEPRAWGHDLALGRAIPGRDGVYRARSVDPGVSNSALTARRVTNVEDALIARIDRARRKQRAH